MFPLENIPFGVFRETKKDSQPRCCTRIADFVIDLGFLESQGFFTGELFNGLKTKKVFFEPTLNKFIALGKGYWHEARFMIQQLFTRDSGHELSDWR